MAFNGFVNSFTNSPIQPTDVSYLPIVMTGSTLAIQLEWVFQNPAATYPFCQFIDITGAVSGATYSIILPNALYSSTLQSTIIYNQGLSDVTIKNYAGTTVGVCEPSLSYFIGNTDNTAAAGDWSVFLELGAGTSSVTAASLIDSTTVLPSEPSAGGLKAYSQYLKVNETIFEYAGTTYVGNQNDLGNIVTWTAGSGTYTLPLASSVSNGFITALQNRSSTGGVINITPNAGGTDNINGANAVLQMQVNESTYLVSDGDTNWYTVSYSSNIDYVIQDIAYNLVSSGGTINVSNADAAYQIQTFIGTWSGGSQVIVTLPATLVQQYFINNTSSVNTLLVYVLGESVDAYKYTLLPNTRMTGFTDGTHLYNSPNFISNDTVYLADGTITTPQLTFVNATTTGLFLQTSGTYTDALGITQGGVATMYFDNTQNTSIFPLALPLGETTEPSLFFGSDGTSGLYKTTSGTYSGAVTIGQANTDTMYFLNTGNTTIGSFNKVGGSYLDNSISIYSMMRAYG